MLQLRLSLGSARERRALGRALKQTSAGHGVPSPLLAIKPSSRLVLCFNKAPAGALGPAAVGTWLQASRRIGPDSPQSAGRRPRTHT